MDIILTKCIQYRHHNHPVTLQSRGALEDKNTMLTETVTRLREDVHAADSRRQAVEQEQRLLHQEIADTTRKLSVAEASLEVANKVIECNNEYRNKYSLINVPAYNWPSYIIWLTISYDSPYNLPCYMCVIYGLHWPGLPYNMASTGSTDSTYRYHVIWLTI